MDAPLSIFGNPNPPSLGFRALHFSRRHPPSLPPTNRISSLLSSSVPTPSTAASAASRIWFQPTAPAASRAHLPSLSSLPPFFLLFRASLLLLLLSLLPPFPSLLCLTFPLFLSLQRGRHGEEHGHGKKRGTSPLQSGAHPPPKRGTPPCRRGARRPHLLEHASAPQGGTPQQQRGARRFTDPGHKSVQKRGTNQLQSGARLHNPGHISVIIRGTRPG